MLKFVLVIVDTPISRPNKLVPANGESRGQDLTYLIQEIGPHLHNLDRPVWIGLSTKGLVLGIESSDRHLG